MRKTYRKLTAILAVFTILTIGASGLTGCSREVQIPPSTEAPEEEPVNFTTIGASETMVETKDRLYFKYRDILWRMNKIDDQIEQLYTFEDGESNAVFWIYNNNLYFDITGAEGEADSKNCGLYKMNLETKETGRIGELPEVPSVLYAADGILYAKGAGMLKLLSLNEDGSLDKEVPKEETIYAKIPEGCEELYQSMLPFFVEQNGYMPLTNGENLVIADVNGENPRSVPEVTNTSSVLFTKDSFYYVHQDGEGNSTGRRVALDTLEASDLFETTGYPLLMQYRNGSLYYMESGSYDTIGSDSHFFQLNVENNRNTLAATMTVEPGTSGFYSYYGNFYVTDETVYCQQIKDYGVYIEKTRLPDLKEKLMMETPLYESKIKGLGGVQAETKAVLCADGEKTAAEVYVEKFVFDGNSDAALTMNQAMEEDVQSRLSYGGQMVDGTDESWIHDESFRTNTLTYQVGELPYLDDQYVDIVVNGYEYTGGAHGMPSRTDYIFDRQTGKRLGLSDIVGVSEEELKTIVSSHFKTLSEETNFSFDDPETLEKTVAERINMDFPFYITSEGVAFYFAPYDIAAYAAGFPQVVVPYAELNTKIPLGKKQ